jgi:hypothetical protein
VKKALVTLGVSFLAHAVAAGVLFAPTLLRSRGKATLSGETFEVPAPPNADEELANAVPSTEIPAPETEEATAEQTPSPRAKATPRPSQVGRPSGGRSHGAPEGTPGGSSGPALYGAVGDRSATDLATAFTRGFPQVASVDPLWRSATIGPAGEATVTLTIDEQGRLERTDIAGSPSPALAAAIRKTIALIGGRAFVAHGKTTKLHLVATVSNDAVHDESKSPVFAIGGSYTGNEGGAFFALAIGRRVDLRVRTR